MITKSGAASLQFVRALATGALSSIAVTYLLHVFGEWKFENYRPDPQTTTWPTFYNTCAVLNDTHILRPASALSSPGDGIDGTKLAGSFMNFFDGHIVFISALSLVFGILAFAVRKAIKRTY